MTKKKSTKRALISSLLILAMCFTMLVGTTFAWFTDSVASGSNIIKSGKLDVDLLAKGGNIDATGLTADSEGYYSLEENPGLKIFNYDKWEPGYTVVANAKVVNKGNLALKYTMKIAATGAVSTLADVIDVYYAPSVVAVTDRTLTGLTKLGTLAQVIAGGADVTINDQLLAEEKDYATIALQMQTTAGNEYQEISLGDGFTIQILATQYTYEEDAFDDQYDKDAEFPVAVSNVSTNAEINAAFDAAENDGKLNVIEFTDDITASGLGLFNNKAGYSKSTNKNVEIDLNGHTWEIGAPAVGSTGTETQALHIEKGNKVVVKNGTIKASNATGVLMLVQNYGDLTLDNCTLIFDDDYALSSNCGKVIIRDTTITVPADKTAFDVCVTNYYPDGTQVTVEGNSVINGKVEFDVWGTKPAEVKSTLTINGGTFNGYKLIGITLDEAKAMTTDNANVNLFA